MLVPGHSSQTESNRTRSVAFRVAVAPRPSAAGSSWPRPLLNSYKLLSL